jgi:type VI secretion system protein ImpK
MSSPTVPPSLFGAAGAARAEAIPGAAPREAGSLLDLLYEGFYVVFLLRAGRGPTDGEGFRQQVRGFLSDFERGARKLGADADDVLLGKFAFCALVDEVMLQSRFDARGAWEVRPLQLELFGEQLAGERFFEHLDRLRQGGAARVQVLEVLHLCLLLGFHGRYLIDGSEKLGWLTARLGEEIAHLRGRRAGFAPHAEPPDHVVHQLRNEVPVWAIGAVFALVGLLGFVGLRVLLQHGTDDELAAFERVIAHTPRQAHLTIRWP